MEVKSKQGGHTESDERIDKKGYADAPLADEEWLQTVQWRSQEKWKLGENASKKIGRYRTRWFVSWWV